MAVVCMSVFLTCASHLAGEVTGLHWSPDSELLAVVLHVGDLPAGPPPSHAACAPGNGSAAGRANGAGPWVGGGDAALAGHVAVQIWLRSNWHWYLKQARLRMHCLLPSLPARNAEETEAILRDPVNLCMLTMCVALLLRCKPHLQFCYSA